MLGAIFRGLSNVLNAPTTRCRAFLAALFVFLPSLFIVPAVPAQEDRAPAATTRAPIGAGSAPRDGMFRIDVVVSDAAGNPVTGLQPGDFTLLDNGKSTRIFTMRSSTAREAASEPLPELIFVFNEDSMPPEQSARAEQAVENYLRQDGGHLAQPVLLYRVAHDGLFASAKPSIDGNFLALESKKRKQPRRLWPTGTTSPGKLLLDKSGRQTFRTAGVLGLISVDQRKIAGRKILVWFGDSSVVAWRWCNFNEGVELSTRLREARIAVNVLMTPGAEHISDAGDLIEAAALKSPNQPAMLTLSAIASHTGGLVLNSWDDLKAGIERCAAESRTFYSLTFDPPRTEHADEYHHLAVAISRAGRRARTYAGYYNQPVYWDHPRPNLEKVTVAQLEDIVRRQVGNSDFPRRLGNMELTERLMPAMRTQLLALLHDDREREAFTAVADISEFLPPPPGETLTDPFPGRQATADLLKRTVDYVADATHKLPDFFATRTAIAYQEPQVRDEDSCQIPSTEQPLRVAFTARATVLYRNGAEVVEAEKSKHKKLLNKREHALDTHGIFGPVLAAVLSAAADRQSSLSWSRWEESEQGKLAVFRFVIPFSIFNITHCCLPEGDGTTVYRATPGYRGEFAVDPSSSAIMRVAIEADLDEDRDPHDPLIRSAQMIEYGPVEIGGKRYISPLRSVSVLRGRTNKVIYDWGIPFIVNGPYELLVNDFTFSEYHKFGSESRILTGFEEIPDSNGSGSDKSKPATRPH